MSGTRGGFIFFPPSPRPSAEFDATSDAPRVRGGPTPFEDASSGAAVINLQLLGGLAIDGPELSPNASARRRRSLALLAVVAGHAPNAVARDKIQALLWPESDGERARNSLRQTLFWLRKDLGEDFFLPETASGLEIDPTKAAVDVWRFREALEREAHEEAARLYAGPFLDGFHIPDLSEFSHWVDGERESLERRYLAALEALARLAESSGRLDEAVAWRRRQAEADPFSSRAALALLRALAAAGDRTGALEYAGVYESMVRTHLEAEPDPTLQAYVTSLRQPSDPAPDPASSSGRGREAHPGASASEDAVGERAGSAGATRVEPDGAATGPAAGAAREGVRPEARWGVLAALVVVTIFAGWSILDRSDAPGPAPDPTPSVVIVGSGMSPVAGRDTATEIISCDGPGCPGGDLPQAAYVVAKHSAYGNPVAGTNYIAPVPDATTVPPPGYPCCSSAVFETAFVLPPEATTATITVSMLADNVADLSVNGVPFGERADSMAVGNYVGPPRVLRTIFPPAAGGENRLRITLWDGGGALGFFFHAVVTWEVTPDTDGDGVPDDADPFPVSDRAPTVVIGGCDSRVTNQMAPDSSGATMADRLARALGAEPDREDVDRSPASLVDRWREEGRISRRERGRLLSCLEPRR